MDSRIDLTEHGDFQRPMKTEEPMVEESLLDAFGFSCSRFYMDDFYIWFYTHESMELYENGDISKEEVRKWWSPFFENFDVILGLIRNNRKFWEDKKQPFLTFIEFKNDRERTELSNRAFFEFLKSEMVYAEAEKIYNAFRINMPKYKINLWYDDFNWNTSINTSYDSWSTDTITSSIIDQKWTTNTNYLVSRMEIDSADNVKDEFYRFCKTPEKSFAESDGSDMYAFAEFIKAPQCLMVGNIERIFPIGDWDFPVDHHNRINDFSLNVTIDGNEILWG